MNTETALSGGLVIGKDLYEEDGYYFLTESARKYLSERVLASLEKPEVLTDEELVEYLVEHHPEYESPKNFAKAGATAQRDHDWLGGKDK